ncbi:MAG: proton-conducting transporter membrane subunit [Phycisphaerales bacterium]
MILAFTGSGARGPALLLAATVAVPALMLLASLSRRWRERMLSLLAFAPLPGLATALFAHDGAQLALDESRLRIALVVDTTRAILLGAAALLWCAAGAYAATYLRGKPHGGRFAVSWLLTLTGCLGVFIAGDLATFYFFFAIVSLAAYGLVMHDDTAAARRAAVVYLALAIFGEVCLLLAFVLLAHAAPGDTLRIQDVVAALPTSPRRDQTLVFLVLGFGLKAGLVPLHGWLPLAHPAAPMPASAVLSGAIIKTGVIGLVCFLPLGAAMPGWGGALTAVGLLTALYGVLIGITQANPKTVLAYSSVSQMGVVAAVLGMGWRAGDGAAAMAAAFYAVHHVLVKGALFLAVGVIAATGARRRWRVLLPAAVLALSLAGLPLTGGALAKLATKPFLDHGVVGVLAACSSAGTALLMLHFLRRVAAGAAPDTEASPPAGIEAPWLAMAIAAVAVPWMLCSIATGAAPTEALAPKALWASLWPVLVGAALAVALWRLGARLPRVPEGDVLVAGERAARSIAARGALLEPVDLALRRWPVAGMALLAMLIALGAMIVAGTR